MRIGLLGGLRVEQDGRPITVSGQMQLAVLFRLAVDAGTSVSYRAIAEDIWGLDAPENTKGALQSIVSRLRSQLPADSIESTTGGYRLAVARADVDALQFTDLVAAAATSENGADLASDALALWTGEPWIPSDNFDWFVRDLAVDHARAVELGGSAARARTTTELPAQLTELVGRGVELQLIADQLASNRLVTLIGTGGAGKTRLALEAAGLRRGALLVELAPVGPSEVLASVLGATGREIRVIEGMVDSGNTRDRVLDALAGRDVLLVLDNCEHVIDSAAEVAQDLLSNLPHLRILATSREPLGIPGEAFVALGSLGHAPDADIDSLGPSELLTYDAIELFSRRTASARGSGLSDAELRSAARICARLDGLPLALELAAAKLRTLSVDEVLEGLDDRFSLLTGGYRTALPRHQTLRAMIDWSWSLLDDHERKALLAFAVFPAGISAADAPSLASELGLKDASVFDALVDRSLLQRTRGRFRALETVREYGIGRLSESGDLRKAREAQSRFVAANARSHDKMLRGPRIIDALAWFDAEEDNITSALRYVAGVPIPELAVGLVIACAWYWIIRDRNEEAQDWFGKIAPFAKQLDGIEAHAITLMTDVMAGVGDVEPADFGESSERIAKMLEPLKGLRVPAGEHDLLQLIEPFVSAFAKALASHQWISSVQIPDPAQYELDPWPTALLYVARAAMAQNRGAMAELGEASDTGLALFRAQGDLWGIAISEQMQAIYLAASGKLIEALEMTDASTEHMRNITTNWDLAQQQGLAVQLLLRLNRKDDAVARVNAMLAEARESGIGRTIMQAEIGATALDLYLGDLASASSRMLVIDDLRPAWHGEPGQILAMIDALKGTIELRKGNLDAAELHLREAAAAAIRSQDQPVIGAIAINVGSYALARGDVETAVAAIDFSTKMIGAYDGTHPEVVAIVKAADAQGIGRPSTEVPERPITIADLQELIGVAADAS